MSAQVSSVMHLRTEHIGSNQPGEYMEHEQLIVSRDKENNPSMKLEYTAPVLTMLTVMNIELAGGSGSDASSLAVS